MAQAVRLLSADEALAVVRQHFKSPVRRIGFLTLADLIAVASQQPQERGRFALGDKLKNVEPFGVSPYAAFVIIKTYDKTVPYIVLPPPSRLRLPPTLIFEVIEIAVGDVDSCIDVVSRIDRATGYAADYDYGVLCGALPEAVPDPLPPPAPRPQEERAEPPARREERAVNVRAGVPEEVARLWESDPLFRMVVAAMANTESLEVAYYKLGIPLERLARAWRRICDPVEAVMRAYSLPEEARGKVVKLLAALEWLLAKDVDISRLLEL